MFILIIISLAPMLLLSFAEKLNKFDKNSLVFPGFVRPVINKSCFDHVIKYFIRHIFTDVELIIIIHPTSEIV